MKLNYKRTILVGFAFFLICAFWQAYDAIVPLMLTNKFGLNQGASGIIMSLDNILALFMLPLFGSLSDRVHTRFGKRTPFIVIGTVCAVLSFVGLSLADAAQLKKLSADQATLWSATADCTVEYKENNSLIDADAQDTIVLRDYAAKMYFNASYDELSADQQAELSAWFANELSYDTVYSYDNTTDRYTVYASASDAPSGQRTSNAYSALVSSATNVYAWQVTRTQPFTLVLFIVLLLLTLISMATFRSPAVALMPDVTPKPLRSKGNAIINLMGTAGGILVLALGMLFNTGAMSNQMMSYVWYVLVVGAIMLAALAVFVLTVREKQWAAEVVIDEPTEPNAEQDKTTATDGKLPKDKKRSLLFILASVALWYVGYNAITSKYSVYAVNVLDKDFNSTLMIAQIAAIIAYIPVGMVASKLGRKRTILAGVALLTVAFGGAIFITSSSPQWLLTLLFVLAGIAWATINVNSFPMVVELAKGSDTGKYTGYYYTASMAAQIVTPILSGYLMQAFHSMSILFPYGTIFVALSFVTMLFVKHGDSKPDSVAESIPDAE